MSEDVRKCPNPENALSPKRLPLNAMRIWRRNASDIRYGEVENEPKCAQMSHLKNALSPKRRAGKEMQLEAQEPSDISCNVPECAGMFIGHAKRENEPTAVWAIFPAGA